jgi:hypothetical protein
MRNPPQVINLSIAIAAAGCLALTGMPAEAAAGAATISWNPPTQNADGSQLENLAGYRIYYGKKATKLSQTIEIDNPGLARYMVENLAPARWHFAMTSVNSQGVESARSKTVSKLVK